MPKETFKSNGLVGDSTFLEVGWSKVSDSVSLASINPDGGVMIKEKSETGESKLVHVDVLNPGWYIYLNRDEINDLIRVLRRARDQAFGRDE